MQFNVNESVVKMLDVLAKSRSLQVLIVLLTLIAQLPAILRSIALFL